jgi:hypothetical protein
MAFSLSKYAAQNQQAHNTMGVDESHGTRDVRISSNVHGKIVNRLAMVSGDLSGEVALSARFRAPGAP